MSTRLRASASTTHRAGLAIIVTALLSGCGIAAGSPSAAPSSAASASSAVVSNPPPSPVASSAQATSGGVPRLEPANCATVAGAAGRERTCYDLVVPANRGDPGGATVRVRVAVYPSPDADRKPDPVILLSGGPGGSALDWGATAMTVAGWSDRDFVVLDQRGTGVSTPSLDCPEIEESMPREMSMRPSETEGVPPSTEAAVRACRARLVGSGIDLADYSSAVVADDLEDLRGLLGYDRWNLYGVSYGTRIALTVLRDHPAAVRSVILDSPLPLSVDPETAVPAGFVDRLSLVLARCAASDSCGSAHPNLEARFWALVDRLDQAPVRFVSSTQLGDMTLVVDSSTAINVSSLAFYDREFLLRLPTEIDRIERDPTQTWQVSGDATVVGAGIAEGMSLSMMCAEETAFTSMTAVRDAVARLRPAVRSFGLARAAYDLELCQLWDVPTLAGEDAAVASDVPALVLNGELDGVTPPAFGEIAAATLSRAQRFVIPNEIHHLIGSSDCADQLMTDFVAAPMAPVDSSCTTSASPIEFR